MEQQQVKPFIEGTMQELEGGAFARRIQEAIKEATKGVMNHDSRVKGKVSIELTMTPVKNSSQVHLDYKLALTAPTGKGKFAEESTDSCPVYASTSGDLTIFPQNQTDMFRAPKAPQEVND